METSCNALSRRMCCHVYSYLLLSSTRERFNKTAQWPSTSPSPKYISLLANEPTERQYYPRSLLRCSYLVLGCKVVVSVQRKIPFWLELCGFYGYISYDSVACEQGVQVVRLSYLRSETKWEADWVYKSKPRR